MCSSSFIFPSSRVCARFSAFSLCAQQQSITKHTCRLLAVARDMLRAASAFSKSLPEGYPSPLQLRIGVHTGDIVGGVIGSRVLRYNFWGDDVVLANQIESRGVPGRVVVSAATRALFFVGDDAVGLEFVPHHSSARKAAEKPIESLFLVSSICHTLPSSPLHSTPRKVHRRYTPR